MLGRGDHSDRCPAQVSKSATPSRSAAFRGTLSRAIHARSACRRLLPFQSRAILRAARHPCLRLNAGCLRFRRKGLRERRSRLGGRLVSAGRPLLARERLVQGSRALGRQKAAARQTGGEPCRCHCAFRLETPEGGREPFPQARIEPKRALALGETRAASRPPVRLAHCRLPSRHLRDARRRAWTTVSGMPHSDSHQLTVN